MKSTRQHVGIIHYDAGNTYSVKAALATMETPATIIALPEECASVDAMILPGVGNFGPALGRMRQTGLDEAILEAVESGKPLLGICLGMQALFESSAEAPGVPGLGLLKGAVERIPAPTRSPHMGWSLVEFQDSSADWFYFANSYWIEASSSAFAWCTHGRRFVAAVRQGPITGVQFHPEKSGIAGLKFLEDWCARAG